MSEPSTLMIVTTFGNLAASIYALYLAWRHPSWPVLLANAVLFATGLTLVSMR